MKALFKNTTRYDNETCNDFMNFHIEKYGRRDSVKFILIGILILYIIIMNIIYKNWIFFLGVLIFIILLYFYKTVMSKKAKKKSRRKKNEVKEYTFYFYSKYIKIRYKRQFRKLRYFELHKVFETKEYFFLYMDEVNSLIISKDGFSIGTPEEFSKFIKGKCIFRYKNEE